MYMFHYHSNHNYLLYLQDIEKHNYFIFLRRKKNVFHFTSKCPELKVGFNVKYISQLDFKF